MEWHGTSTGACHLRNLASTEDGTFRGAVLILVWILRTLNILDYERYPYFSIPLKAITGRNVPTGGFQSTRRPSTGWFKVPAAVPFRELTTQPPRQHLDTGDQHLQKADYLLQAALQVNNVLDVVRALSNIGACIHAKVNRSLLNLKIANAYA